MTADERAARRQRQKDIEKRAATVQATGLPRRAGAVDLAALAQVLETALDRPADVARAAHAVFETSARQQAPVAQLACMKGCAYCCHGMVAITAPEVFHLANTVRRQGPDAASGFRARAAHTANRTADARFGAKLPCPLLGADNTCSVYAARPLSCRQVTAFDLAPCREEFDGQTGDIAVPEHYVEHARQTQIAVATALHRAGLPLRFYELSAAVLRALETPDAERCWRNGEDVFAGIHEDTTAVDALTAAASRLARGTATKP